MRLWTWILAKDVWRLLFKYAVKYNSPLIVLQRQVLNFLLHYIYLTTLATSYISNYIFIIALLSGENLSSLFILIFFVIKD